MVPGTLGGEGSRANEGGDPSNAPPPKLGNGAEVIHAGPVSTTNATPETTTAVSRLHGTRELQGLAAESQGWDAVETAARIRSGAVSSGEVVEAAIARAEAWEPQLNAIARELYDRGRQRARAPSAGVFAGVPSFVKDMEDLEGAATTLGSAAVPPSAAKRTASSVAQFLSSGVIPLGKSTTAEFGLNASTEPVFGKPTCNPRHLGHSAGGSSGGAAALVAAGVVPIAHGGDGGGSIRIPAAFCGLVGLKASRGRLVPMDTTKQMPLKIATYGILTRTVRDTAAFYAQVAPGPVAGMPAIGNVEGPGKERWRIGLFVDPPTGAPVHPEIRAAVLATAKALESLGHSVDFVTAPYSLQLADDFLLYWSLLAFGVERAVKGLPGGDVTRLEPWTRQLARNAKARWWRHPGALYRLHRYADTYNRVFRRCDVVLCPTTAGPAPPLGFLSPGQPFEQQLGRLTALLPYTPVQNTAGGPAISLPMARTQEGLPIGVQLAAPLGQERRLLELAFALEPSFAKG